MSASSVNTDATLRERWNSFTKEDGFVAVCEWTFQSLADIDTQDPGCKHILLRLPAKDPNSATESDHPGPESAWRHGVRRQPGETETTSETEQDTARGGGGRYIGGDAGGFGDFPVHAPLPCRHPDGNRKDGGTESGRSQSPPGERLGRKARRPPRALRYWDHPSASRRLRQSGRDFCWTRGCAAFERRRRGAGPKAIGQIGEGGLE